MAELLWEPAEADIAASRIADFAAFVARTRGVDVGTYAGLWAWSVEELGEFWQAVWDYFEISTATDTDPGPALVTAEMPGAQWFPHARINYVDEIFKRGDDARPAIIDLGERRDAAETSWPELRRQVAALAHTLRAGGVGLGDQVVGYLPNIPEAVVAFLATASIGATWAACGQDYSAPAAIDRLGQLEPVVLVTADGYRFGGKDRRQLDAVGELRAGLPSLRQTIVVPRLGEPNLPDGSLAWADATAGEHDLVTERVPFDHPLWVVFSSGTTGLPKGIVHGHGGVLLEHLKATVLQSDLGPADTFFWFTSPSWMMWNFQVAGLLAGATIVTYDGSPATPTPDALWALAARHQVTFLGTSPGYVLACEKAGAHPAAEHDLSALMVLGVTGATLPASSARWIMAEVGERVQIASISGGTDVVTAFIGAAPNVPVWAGELSARYLGVALAAYDDHARPVTGEVGELVITAPMPSMPVRFWNDPDGARYLAAYFDTYPGVWRHGDWVLVTDRGSVEVHGRSDSTLNRNGIRMGSADIYQAVESLPEVAESMVLGVEEPGGGYWMPLFVVLREGFALDDALRERIRTAVREQASPRHVPDEILEAPGIPHTRTGKKLEVPVKRLLMGADPATTIDLTAVDVPELIDWYVGQSRG
ncbi:acetoacetate--CoA ligase [Tomitella biformata]|uniref:acetoacetate--CoA ligase n=1 Tax=Tomitella biformata TaxID=630403 RepID=UPI000466A470|nr:acetoacetate--CoA ligase [Tomitella biformata]